MRLILLTADDFGINEKVDEAIITCFKNDSVSITSAIVNMTNPEYLKKIAENNGFLDRVGFHLNLCEDKPLTDDIKTCKTFCDDEGNFTSSFLNNKKKHLFLSKRERKAVEKEIAAQMKTFIESGFVFKNVDSHKHYHNYPSLFPIVLKKAKLFGFTRMRMVRNKTNNFVKRAYIKHTNKIIKKNFLSSCAFLSAKDYVDDPVISNNIVEIMAHPSFDNFGNLVNLRSYNFETILSKIKDNGDVLVLKSIEHIYGKH